MKTKFNITFQQLCRAAGLQFLSQTTVAGGDSNSSYKITTESGDFFLKINHSTGASGVFEKEEEGLGELRKQTFCKVPEVIGRGEFEGYQYLLLEWLVSKNANSYYWENLGKGLAELHKTSHPLFGYYTHNYIGGLVQLNTQATTWAEFFATTRIMPLVAKLFDASVFNSVQLRHAEKLCKQVSDIFPNEPPALLHGDLWSGNCMAVSNREDQVVPAMYDPAVYYGHREMDLGMTLLFGGFENKFYDAYHSYYPLEAKWKERVALAQLYPLLVHAILFRGSYIERCRQILKIWGC